MEISNRLLQIANMVAPCKIAADIGTDHGYLPIALILSGKIQRGIACDVKEGPLLKAKEHILAYGLQNKVETRLGSGLAPLKPGEAEVIIMAGMGGMLMIRILQEGRETLQQTKQLVLQPQLDIPEVRKAIHAMGFRIQKEASLLEEGQFYTILSAKPGKESYEREEEYWFGKYRLEQKDPILLEEIKRAYEKQQDIIQKLQEADTETARKKLQQLSDKHRKYKEVLEWLSNAD